MTTENTPKKKYGSLAQGLGITGLVVGIVTLLVSFIPCFGVFAIVFGVIAVAVSLTGLVIALKHDHAKGLIIGGLLTAFLGCAIAYTQYAAISKLGDKAVEEIQKENEIQEKKI